MSLLEKAKVITTPTAYSDGFLHSVKPSVVLGNELVVNGGFDTDANWTKGTGWVISGGVASHSGGTASYLSQAVLGASKTYRVLIKVVSADASNFVQIYMGNSPASATITSVGEYEYTFTSQSSILLGFAIRGIGNVSIDNVSVKEKIDADFTFTRNSSATRVGEDGYIQDIATNLPRINYEGFSYDNGLPIYGSGKGYLLLEGQSTNLCTRSEQIGNWSFPSNVTLTQNYGISPDGSVNSSRLQFTSNGFVNDALTLVSGTEYTISVYAKRNNSGTESFGFYVDGAPTIVGQMNLTSEWQRFTYTYTASSSSSIGLSGNSGADVSVFGFQAEVGNISSYIPTNGSAVTRVAETCTNAGNADLFDSEGVLYAEIAALANDGTSREITISDGSTINRIILSFDNLNRIRVKYINAATNVFDEFYVTDITEYNKIAIRSREDDFSLWINGTLIAAETSGSILPINTLNRLNFDNAYGGLPFYGKTKMVAVFPYLSNDEMECLTSI
jgi:hypothetical protein